MLCIFLENLTTNSSGVYYNCDGLCINDSDGDGVCDELEINGCSDVSACNYDNTVTDDDGSCIYATLIYDCNGNCWLDSDTDSVCDQEEIIGCQDSTGCNYDATATDEGECTYAATYYDCSNQCIYEHHRAREWERIVV